MWFWYFWGISFAASFIIMVAAMVSQQRRIVRKHHLIAEKITFLERIMSYSRVFFISLIPFINCIFTILVIILTTSTKGDKLIYDKFIKSKENYDE